MSSTSYEVKTFVSTDVKVLNEVMLDINLNNDRILPLPILINDSFNIEFIFTDFKLALHNFNKLNCKLAANYEYTD